MIKSFRDGDTRQLFERKRVARFRNIESAARRTLEMLNVAPGSLADLG